MEKPKFKNLDGLRGLAALIVVFWHLTLAFTPFLMGMYATERSTPLDPVISNTPLALLLAGDFAVIVFFVLSGFVLSLSFFHTRDSKHLVSSAARRYFRLAIPAFGSVMLAYLVYRLSGSGIPSATAAITQSLWAQNYWQMPAQFFTALYQGVYGVFAGGLTAEHYNTSLWTMHYELLGSFLVYLFLALFGNLPRRWVFYVVFGIICMRSYFLPFIIGMALCDLWVNREALISRINTKLAGVLLLGGMLLGSLRLSNFRSDLGFSLPGFSDTQLLLLLWTIGAACLIVAILRLNWLSRFFESRPLQYLGRISFSLYLLHFIVIYSLTFYLFNLAYHQVGYVAALAIALAVSLPVIFGLSHLYEKYVDRTAIAWSRRIGNWLLGKRATSAAQRVPATGDKPQSSLAYDQS